MRDGVCVLQTIQVAKLAFSARSGKGEGGTSFSVSRTECPRRAAALHRQGTAKILRGAAIFLQGTPQGEKALQRRQGKAANGGDAGR